MKRFNEGISSVWHETYLMLTAYLNTPCTSHLDIMHQACSRLASHFGNNSVEGYCSDHSSYSENIEATRFSALVDSRRILDISPIARSISLECKRTPPHDELPVPLASRWWGLYFDAMDEKYEITAPYAIINLAINTRKLEPVPMDWHQEFIEAFFQIADAAGECWYGVADIASAADSMGGGYFISGRPGGPMSWHRGLEVYDWHPEGVIHRRPRGVYWGNYFGREILAKVDRQGDLVERFLAHRFSKFGKDRQRAFRWSNGAFLCMTHWPRDMYKFYTFPPNADNELEKAVWLKGELRKASLL